MTNTYFDPLPDSPYYLRILDAGQHHDEISRTLVNALDCSRLWDGKSPGINRLAEPVKGGIYTELVHRDLGRAGMMEVLSYDSLKEHNATYPMLGYFTSFIRNESRGMNHHLRTVFLEPEFRQRHKAILFFILLNGFYLRQNGIQNIAFNLCRPSVFMARICKHLGAAELEALNAVMKLEGRANQQFAVLDLDSCSRKMLSIYEQHYHCHVPQSWLGHRELISA